MDIEAIKSYKRPPGLPFQIQKIGHIVLNVRDIDASVKFYTQVLGFQVSDVYPETMVPGGMVFMRFHHDHHGVALVGAPAAANGEARPHTELHHFAFEAASLDEVFLAREHLRKNNVKIDFEGRRRAGCQIAVEFPDPDGNSLEIYWNLDQVGTDGYVRPATEWKQAFTLEAAVADPVRGQDTTLHRVSLAEG